MNKRTIALIAAVSLAGQAHAFPIEAVTTFFSKLFRGGVAKEGAIAGRAADGTAAAKGLEHLPAGDAVKTAPSLQVVEPKPSMASEPIAKSRKDADAYKALRASAEKGDAAAMLRMSEMTSSGKVTDPGEPWPGYWMFQAARLGNQAATRKADSECAVDDVRRESERWFDSACASSDGRHLFLGDKQLGANSAPRTDALSKSRAQSVSKQ